MYSCIVWNNIINSTGLWDMWKENLQNKKARFEKIVKIQEKTVQSQKDSPVKKFEADVKIQDNTVQSNKDSLVKEFEADDESWVNDDSFKEYWEHLFGHFSLDILNWYIVLLNT